MGDMTKAWWTAGPILSTNKGGAATCAGNQYCKIFQKRPEDLELRLPCHGAGLWEPCPDLARCRENPAPRRSPRQARAAGEGPFYYLSALVGRTEGE